jgi:site-specific DNA recombinase
MNWCVRLRARYPSAIMRPFATKPAPRPVRWRHEGFRMSAAAIYARYSSDLQREASIEDQNRICRERAAKEGWSIYNEYSDSGISAASLIRPGIQKLLRDALDGRFGIIIAESLDRLSRDQEDIAHIFKRVSFAGGRIVTLSEGDINELHIGLKGTMGALYLKDLADKTRRGLRGRVEAGKSGGGNSYGYDVVRGLGADGQPLTGERKINAREAAIVRRICEEYAAGVSPRAIAKRLNAENVPGSIRQYVGTKHHPRQPPARHRHSQ